MYKMGSVHKTSARVLIQPMHPLPNLEPANNNRHDDLRVGPWVERQERTLARAPRRRHTNTGKTASIALSDTPFDCERGRSNPTNLFQDGKRGPGDVCVSPRDEAFQVFASHGINPIKAMLDGNAGMCLGWGARYKYHPHPPRPRIPRIPPPFRFPSGDGLAHQITKVLDETAGRHVLSQTREPSSNGRPHPWTSADSAVAPNERPAKKKKTWCPRSPRSRGGTRSDSGC